MKDFKTPATDLIFKPKGAAPAESSIPLSGDLTVGGSEVIIGVEVAGPQSLFDCLKDFS